jgi:Zn-finger nucleic acid-binding protein
MMLYCARCQDATISIDLSGNPAHVCPQCGAVYVHRHGNIYSMVADLRGAQGVKELLHACRPCREEKAISA